MSTDDRRLKAEFSRVRPCDLDDARQEAELAIAMSEDPAVAVRRFRRKRALIYKREMSWADLERIG